MLTSRGMNLQRNFGMVTSFFSSQFIFAKRSKYLNDVLQGGLVVSQHSRCSVVVAWQLADLGHGGHQGLGELKDVPLDQALDDFEKLLHYHSDALVPKKPRHGPEMWRTNKPGVLPK